MAMGNTVKTQIIDKNGKVTHVHKNSGDAVEPIRFSLPPVAKAATKYSGQEIFQKAPIELGEEEQYDFTFEDGVSNDYDIVKADIYRHDNDEDGTTSYTASGYSCYQDPKHWLAEYVFDIKDENKQLDFISENSEIIDRFLNREYDVSRVEWTDDNEFEMVWEYNSPNPISTDEALDSWDNSDSVNFYNESDPGTFGSRNLWRAMGDDIKAANEVKDYSLEELREFVGEQSYMNNHESYLRAAAFDARINGTDGLSVIAQRDIVSNSFSPADAIAAVALNNSDESVQLMAVESNKIGNVDLTKIRNKTEHSSVISAIDDVFNKQIMSDFK